MSTNTETLKPQSAPLHRKPSSWSEDLKSYRDTRGSRSLSAISSKNDVPKRFSRTTYTPFLDTKHPLYAYNDFADKPDMTHPDLVIQKERYSRHGWGDTSLIKEEGYAGKPHPRTAPHRGKGMPEPPFGHDRNGLFGVLQRTEVGANDSWIGNNLIDPTKGKGIPVQPQDPKGRRDLFDVLHGRNPGMPSDDSWLGHQLIDPAKGKYHPEGPEERRGRRDLQEIYTQAILRETPERQLELLQRGADPLEDGWIGNRLVHPSSGKASVPGVPASDQVMHGATFRGVPDGFSDMPRPHQRFVPPPVEDQASRVLSGQEAGADDWGRRGKHHLEEALGEERTIPRNDHLYAHMTFRPLTAVEQTTWSKSFHDNKNHARRTLEVPQAKGAGKGYDMLHFMPHQRCASYVPFGGLAQERRTAKTVAGKSDAPFSFRT